MNNNSTPSISICCVTYNHELYIRDTIEGFLMQKTSYPIGEIIIHDDASTDRTAEIIKEYVTKHPNLIIPILQTENQHSKHNGSISAQFVYPRVKNKYIAICEGDDYWYDPLKLQKQIDILEANHAINLVFTNKLIKDNKGFKPVFYKNRYYTTNDILSGFNPGLQTICFRKDAINFEEYKILNYHINGDRLIPYLCSLSGKIFRLKDYTSIYRMTGMGVATSRPEEKILEISMDDLWKFHETLGFPNNRMLTKGQMRYLSKVLTKNFLSQQSVGMEFYNHLKKYQNITLSKIFWSCWYLMFILIEKVVDKFIIKIWSKFGLIPLLPTKN